MKSLNDYALYRLHKALLLYVPPILLAFGIVGNALAFAVLTRRSIRGVSAYVYLTVLSVTDTVVLVIGLLRMWVSQLTGYDVRDQSGPWMCKLLMMAGYTASDYSVWLIVAVTAERFVAVAFPLSALHRGFGAGSGVQRAAGVVIGMFLVLVTVNGHFLWTVDIELVGGGSSFTNHSSYPKCSSVKGFERLMALWPWVDAVIYSLLPLLILSVLNALIIYSVYRARRRRISLLATGGRGDKVIAVDWSPERAGERQAVKAAAAATNTSGEAERLTIMLLAVSFAFLATTLPNCILLIVKSLRSPGWHVQTTLSVLVAQTVGELLMYANHSVNFYLYCATGRKFRYQLVLMFTSSLRRRQRQQQEIGSSATSTTRNNASTTTTLSRWHQQQQQRSDATVLTVMPPASYSCSSGSSSAAGCRASRHNKTPSPSNRCSDIGNSSLRGNVHAEQILLLTDP